MNLKKARNFILSVPIIIVIIFVFILILPLLPLLILIHFAYGYWLIFQVRRQWFPLHKKILFVYSDSPKWKHDLESTVIPQISQSSIILNWSDHQHWPKSLATKVFFYYSRIPEVVTHIRKINHHPQYYPIAIVFNSWQKPKIIRFWHAYQEFTSQKNTSRINQLKQELIHQSSL